MVGIGSLVSERSAARSYKYTRFRLGTLQGVARVFNVCSWTSGKWGANRTETGEVAALALARTRADAVCRVGLMDVPPGRDGIDGFFGREKSYRFMYVPYKDDDGHTGT